MFKNEINFKEIITHNLWLKLISLIIAILVWFYVKGEITSGFKI
jgi:hypothetical protein